jgi:hypothetical protein
MQHTCHTVGHECYDNPLLLPVEPTGQSRHRLKTPLPHFSFFKIVLLTKNDTRHVRNTIYLPLSLHKIQQDIMKFIAILVTFVVAFVGSSCAASTEQQHGRKLGKKSAKSAKVENPMNYFSLLSAAQRDFTTCPSPGTTAIASGSAIVTYDSTLLISELCVKLTYSVSSAPSTVTINGPAQVGVHTGAVVFSFTAPAAGFVASGSLIQCFPATTSLTSSQKAALDAGLLYFNIVTATGASTPGGAAAICASGELRGQIFVTP